MTADESTAVRQQGAQCTDGVNACSTASSAVPGCQHYNAAKKRLCNWPCKPGYNYCGNHLFHATGVGEERVPCPVNPKHDVPVSQLQAHLRKCQDAVMAAAARAQPYFCENLNTGAVDAQQVVQQHYHKLQQQHDMHDGGSSSSCNGFSQDSTAARIAAEACASFLKGTAEQRQAAAVEAGPLWFVGLIQKVEAAHAAMGAQHPLSRRLLGGCDGDPQQLFAFSRRLDHLMPFDAKHAAQHASIVGNMQASGLLADAGGRLFVELGAGKGFLTAWLHQVCGAADLLLLDRQANFTKKADRRLRHTRLTRVAVDLKDAALPPLLQLHLTGCTPREHREPQLPKPSTTMYGKSNASQGDECKQPVGQAAAKHRGSRQVNCSYGGLTCCPSGRREVEQSQGMQPGAAETDSSREVQELQQDGQQQQKQQAAVPWVVHGKHLCGAATDFALRACYNATLYPPCSSSSGSSSSSAKGTAAKFEPSASADSSAPALPADVAAAAVNSSSTDSNRSSDSSQFVLQGLAIATCCHHRCGWAAYCGKEQLAAFGIGRREFEVISWLTSWALCGHEAPPGAAGEGEGQAEQQLQQPQQVANSQVSGQGNSEAAGGQCEQASLQTTGEAAAGAATGCCQLYMAGDEAGSLAAVAAAATDAIMAAADTQQQQQQQLDYHPADLLDRQQRIALGMKCKQLIDMGRCAWIRNNLLPVVRHCQQQHSQLDGCPLCISRVAYVDQSVTGENTLLLLGRGSDAASHL